MRKTGRKGGGRCTGGGKREGEKRDSQGGRKPVKKGILMQHCAIFCNQKNVKRREPGLKDWEAGRLNPCPPPPPVK